MSPAADATTRFSSRVADYVAYRPSYPISVIENLDQLFSLPHGALIVDLGSGTGISSKILLDVLAPKAVRVIGVEPNKDMRDAGDEFLAEYVKQGRFESRDGTAESTGLEDGTVDLVVAAQAFHWFDIPKARSECQRVLKSNGVAGVALIWNDRRGVDASAPKEQSFPRLDNPVMNAYDLLLVQRGQEYKKVNHHHTVNEDSLQQFYGPNGFQIQTVPFPQHLTYDRLKGRLLSSSYTPQAGQEGHDELIAELEELFEKYQKDGNIEFIYDTRVFHGVIS